MYGWKKLPASNLRTTWALKFPALPGKTFVINLKTSLLVGQISGKLYLVSSFTVAVLPTARNFVSRRAVVISSICIYGLVRKRIE